MINPDFPHGVDPDVYACQQRQILQMYKPAEHGLAGASNKEIDQLLSGMVMGCKWFLPGMRREHQRLAKC